MNPVMWGEPGGTIRWQPQQPNRKRLWEDRGYTGGDKFGTYWAYEPKWRHDTPSLYRSHLLARLRAIIAKSNTTWEELK